MSNVLTTTDAEVLITRYRRIEAERQAEDADVRAGATPDADYTVMLDDLARHLWTELCRADLAHDPRVQ